MRARLNTTLVPRPSSLWACEENGAELIDLVGGRTLAQYTTSGYPESAAGPDATNIPYSLNVGGHGWHRQSDTGLWASDLTFSVSMWCKLDDTTATDTLIGSWDGTNNQWRVRRTSGNWNFVCHNGSTDDTATSATANNTSWHHIVAVRDPADSGSELRLYVDGSSAATAASASMDTTQSSYFAIGGYGTLSETFDGSLAQIAFWNGTALTSTQVTAIYNGGSGVNIVGRARRSYA